MISATCQQGAHRACVLNDECKCPCHTTPSWLMGLEAVDHPSHYGGDTTYEAIKVIEAWKLGFHLGNALKYVCRAGKKRAADADRITDLKKSLWYIEREIALSANGEQPQPSTTEESANA